MRSSRFTAGDKSSNRVLPDLTLELEGVSYELCAVLQHRGRSIHSGHYVTLLKTTVGWETRDDGVVRLHGDCVAPPVAPGDVYVLVYMQQGAQSQHGDVGDDNSMMAILTSSESNSMVWQ